MFVGAKVTDINNDIYNVEIEDSELGLKKVSFVMPYFDSETFHRIIAALHQEWMEKGNGNPTALPLVQVDLVNLLIAEHQRMKEEAKNAKVDDSGNLTGDIDSGVDDSTAVDEASESGSDPAAGADVSDPSDEQSVLDAVDEALREGPAVQPDDRGNPSVAAAGEPAGQPGAESQPEASGDGQGDNPDAGVQGPTV